MFDLYGLSNVAVHVYGCCGEDTHVPEYDAVSQVGAVCHVSLIRMIETGMSMLPLDPGLTESAGLSNADFTMYLWDIVHARYLHF